MLKKIIGILILCSLFISGLPANTFTGNEQLIKDAIQENLLKTFDDYAEDSEYVNSGNGLDLRDQLKLDKNNSDKLRERDNRINDIKNRLNIGNSRNKSTSTNTNIKPLYGQDPLLEHFHEKCPDTSAILYGVFIQRIQNNITLFKNSGVDPIDFYTAYINDSDKKFVFNAMPQESFTAKEAVSKIPVMKSFIDNMGRFEDNLSKLTLREQIDLIYHDYPSVYSVEQSVSQWDINKIQYVFDNTHLDEPMIENNIPANGDLNKDHWQTYSTNVNNTLNEYNRNIINTGVFYDNYVNHDNLNDGIDLTKIQNVITEMNNSLTTLDKHKYTLAASGISTQLIGVPVLIMGATLIANGAYGAYNNKPHGFYKPTEEPPAVETETNRRIIYYKGEEVKTATGIGEKGSISPTKMDFGMVNEGSYTEAGYIDIAEMELSDTEISAIHNAMIDGGEIEGTTLSDMVKQSQSTGKPVRAMVGRIVNIGDETHSLKTDIKVSNGRFGDYTLTLGDSEGAANAFITSWRVVGASSNEHIGTCLFSLRKLNAAVGVQVAPQGSSGSAQGSSQASPRPSHLSNATTPLGELVNGLKDGQFLSVWTDNTSATLIKEVFTNDDVYEDFKEVSSLSKDTPIFNDSRLIITGNMVQYPVNAGFAPRTIPDYAQILGLVLVGVGGAVAGIALVKNIPILNAICAIVGSILIASGAILIAISTVLFKISDTLARVEDNIMTHMNLLIGINNKYTAPVQSGGVFN